MYELARWHRPGRSYYHVDALTRRHILFKRGGYRTMCGYRVDREDPTLEIMVLPTQDIRDHPEELDLCVNCRKNIHA